MATIFRDWSYRYQWLYDAISRIAAFSVGGTTNFRQLALQNLTLTSDSKILDLCCGSGQTTEFLVKFSQNVIGLDASPLSLKRAQRNVPLATYVQAFAEKIPFADGQFDLVHISVALHEMEHDQLHQIMQEVYRVLKKGGVFAVVDFHKPTNMIFKAGLWLFFWLFETKTAQEFLKIDLPSLLTEYGFTVSQPSLYAGSSLQMIQVRK